MKFGPGLLAFFGLLGIGAVALNIPQGNDSDTSGPTLSLDLGSIQYLPIAYAEDDLLNYEYHAFFKFDHPLLTDQQYLNVRILHPFDGTEVWMIQNLPLVPGAIPRPIHYRMDMLTLSQEGMPEFITATVLCGPFQPDASFEGPQVEVPAGPVVTANVPDGGKRDHFPSTLPYFKPFYPFPPFILPDTISILVRGCEVPNIDLDDTAHGDSDPNDGVYDGDYNACGPAAAANSMKWLMETHPEIADTLGLRALLDSFKILMKLAEDSLIITPNPDDPTMMDTVFKPGGTFWYDVVGGKLELIDKYKLPIKVKYQTHTPNDSTFPTISSPDPTYGHYAENQTGESGIPDFNWICQELENGEDVELHINYWCRDPNNPDSLIFSSGHFVNLVGYAKFGDNCWLMWKHDIDQCGPEGTIEEYGKWGHATSPTDTSANPTEYPVITEMSDTSSAGCVAYVGSAVSESYDPDVIFCPVKVCIPDDDGPGSLREALACAEDGAVITLGAELAGSAIEITSAAFELDKMITIQANPSDEIAIQFATENGFTILETGQLTLKGFKIIAGTAETGSAIVNHGTTTLENMDIRDNEGNLATSVVVENFGELHIEGNTRLQKD